ncbi:hypothetical protein D3878_00865 [Noviherbaspirillum sedimenti]|uniref:Uncharacterized protein n=1 Tax=Noviherbaspirillum sedimenti TaxID=2320865 RepID=A0A3A3FXF2_9BURK|nr:hypothetical protein D3878_00865 [Noviherbaspirillum sedimenti]
MQALPDRLRQRRIVPYCFFMNSRIDQVYQFVAKPHHLGHVQAEGGRDHASNCMQVTGRPCDARRRVPAFAEEKRDVTA